MPESLYELRSCNMFGDNALVHPFFAPLEAAKDELNTYGSFRFSVPVKDARSAQLRPLVREVQLWRGQRLVWWGVITQRSLSGDLTRWEITCAGLMWYFTNLYFGKAGRFNYIENGSFDTGTMAHWTPVGVTANIVTEWGALPNQTFQLNLYQSVPGVDTFAQQTFSVPGGGLYIFQASFHIRADASWVGPALDGRGLYVERLNPSNGAVEDMQFFAITDETPRGVGQLATLQMFAPNKPAIFQVRLYAPAVTNATPTPPRPPGSIIWDQVSCTVMESLSFLYADVGTILNAICVHSQQLEYGKANLNIVPQCPSTGINAARTYQHADHAEIYREIVAFADAGLCDVGVEFNQDGRGRYLTCWTPKRGVQRKRMELDSNQGIRALTSVEEDGTKVVTTPIVLGEGSGPGRSEASASDTSATAGLVRESIVQADEGVHFDLLQGIANSTAARLHRVPQVPQFTVSGTFIGNIGLGDTIPVLIDNLGGESIATDCRVVSTEIDVERDMLQLTVNPL